MYLKTKGLVLREVAYKESDKILTVLTEDHGKMTLKARGVRRSASPMKAACQLLACGEFTIFEYRGMNTINEAQTIELFGELRRDLELLSLTLNALYALGKLGKQQLLVKTAFELRAACQAGFTPDLSGCHVCGSSQPDRFDISAGRMECHDCRPGEAMGIRMPVTPGMLEAMRYICQCDPKRLFSFRTGGENLRQLSSLTEAYLTTQLERGFSTLDFYKSLLLPTGF